MSFPISEIYMHMGCKGRKRLRQDVSKYFTFQNCLCHVQSEHASNLNEGVALHEQHMDIGTTKFLG